MEQITIYKKKPGEKGKRCNVQNALRPLQDAVGGYIEAHAVPRTGLVMVMDEEGRLKGKQLNVVFPFGTAIDVRGTLVVVGSDGEEFRSLTTAELALCEQMLG